MAQPTLVDTVQSLFAAGVAARPTTSGLTWISGDDIYVLGETEDNGLSLTVPVVTGLTGTDLTFTQIAVTNTASNTKNYLWKATAAGSGLGVISATASSPSAAAGIVAWQFRGSDGNGTPVTFNTQTAKTFNLTRVQLDSHVIGGFADWNQVGDVTVTASPSTDGTVRLASAQSGLADFFAFDWSNQGATGTTAYGMANHTGTVKLAGIFVEIKGTAGGGGGTFIPLIGRGPGMALVGRSGLVN